MYERTSSQIKSIIEEPLKHQENEYPIYKSNYLHILGIYEFLWKEIYDFIDSGNLCEEEFKKKLSYFIDNQTKAIWKRIKYYIFEKPTPEHYADLIEKFHSYLETETAENNDELLHVCDVYFMLRNMKIDRFNDKDSNILLKKYIKKYCALFSSNEIDSLNQNTIHDVPEINSSNFREENVDKLKKISKAMECKKNKYISDRNASCLKNYIQSNQFPEFIKLFSQSNSFARNIPFIYKIDADEFLTCIDQVPSGQEQRKIYRWLYLYLQQAAKKIENSETDEAIKSSWQNEREWFETIIEKLQQRADDTATHPLIKQLIELHLKTLREGL